MRMQLHDERQAHETEKYAPTYSEFIFNLTY